MWTFGLTRKKDGIEFLFERDFKLISDSIHKWTVFKNNTRNRDTIVFRDQFDEQNNRSQHYDSSSDEKVHNNDVLYNNQRRLVRHPQSITRNRQLSK